MKHSWFNHIEELSWRIMTDSQLKIMFALKIQADGLPPMEEPLLRAEVCTMFGLDPHSLGDEMIAASVARIYLTYILDALITHKL